ncbi:hypothetical protein LTR36_003679 [Oleoguttula mirabilis]|uniref:N-acetyltransferase domain-containing protein n=1 Tax=Oleoguttula mirabilis TaxID=1507867 RepID=A0AAV9JJG4_9PEZI|nr:hypothetical protein LTR36_003679 [Oleoguttula mirabilis]
MSLPPPTLYDPAKHKSLLPQIAQIQADCILQDNTLATFHPDKYGRMDMQRVLHYWLANSKQVEQGTRAIILQFADDNKEELAGYVSVYMKVSETRPFLGVVEKMMVSPLHRRRGVARQVLGMLEEVAREKGRWLLELDTTVGSGAEFVYPKLGYKELGVVPNYGVDPKGNLVDGMYFYKDLREQE